MKPSPKERPPQKTELRVDGRRNRERLIASARAAFREAGSSVSLNEIANRAGVGIATLYRHFVTRELLIEAVYQREVDQLVSSATELSARSAPSDALHQWLRLAVEYIATKKIIASAISSTEVYGSSGKRIVDVLFGLVDAARRHGDLRADVERGDVLRALVGFTYGTDDPDWRASALRLIDALMTGLRVSKSE